MKRFMGRIGAMPVTDDTVRKKSAGNRQSEVRRFPNWMKAALAMTFLALLVGGNWFYRSQERHTRQHIEQGLAAIARLKANQIANWRQEQLRDASVIMKSPFFAEGAAEWLENGSPEMERGILERFQSLQEYHHFQEVVLVDLEERRRLSLPRDTQPLHPAEVEALNEAFRQRKPVLSALHTNGADGKPHLCIVTPLFTGKGDAEQAVGAVIMTSDPEEFLYPLIQSWPTPTESAETLIVRRDGDSVLFLNNLRYQPSAALHLRIPLTRTDVPAVMAIEGKRGIVRGKDYRGVDVISVLHPVPASPWFMVAKMDVSEAFADWHFRSILILIALSGLVALAAAGGVVAWQLNQRRHFQALYESEAARRANEARYGITLKSIGDGVITTDAEGSVEMLNPVAEALTGWTSEEARGKPLEQVFRIISEETRQPLGNPVERVLKEGRAAGLPKHSVLIARDGTERSVADSGAPILDDKDKMTGVVLVFRDQTHERAAQRQLERIEWMLKPGQHQARSASGARESFLPAYGDLVALNTCRLILDSVGRTMLEDIVRDYLDLLETSAAVYEANGDYALGIFASGWCRFLNEASRRLCGTDDNGEALASGKWHCHESCWACASKACMATGEPVDIECGGSLRLYAVPIRAGGEVVGAINFGYGDPPRDRSTLEKVAEHHGVDVDTLARLANAYESRPPFIIEMAKERLGTSARLIGEIIDRRQAEEKYQTLFNEMLDGFALHEVICDGQGEPVDFRYLAVNPAFERITGEKKAEIIGKTATEALPGTEPEWIRTYGRVALTGEPISHEDYHRGLDRHFEVTAFRPAPNQFACIFSDITERKRGEEEREKLQSQLLQAQKMESVGRLAGGVAHDFNNMLGVILGHAEMALDELASNHPLYDDLQEIQKAGRRSADLTQRLLAFARKQTVAPRVLSLNQTVEGMLKMLQRLIGEDIDLAWDPGTPLWPVKIDPAQIDQILANLAVNARDAIGGVGKLTIETDNAVFDEEYCADHAGFCSGSYVMLAVSDDGQGMDHETLEHVFEPFFTTKKVGEGTGLGLATVYGIVKQNEGFINVYSEVGKGTTFRIYLPRFAGDTMPIAAEPPAPVTQAHGETVMLVEDEAAILSLGKSMLKRLGYTVLAAGTPQEAIRVAENHEGSIHLLITDVVMPEMNGRELAERVTALQPGVKCLFMSGYTSNVIAHRGVLEEGVHFLEKPFSLKGLSTKIREALTDA